MIIYGKQLFLHVVRKRSDKIIKIYLAKECERPLFAEIWRLNKKIIKIDNKKAQALARGGNHQGFLAEVEDFEFADFGTIKNGNFIAILYGISDVGNIGAMVRTAHALGADAVVIVARRAAAEGILRASSAAAWEIPICLASDGLGVLNELKQLNFTILGTAMNGADIKSLKLGEKVALVMGSEGEGLPKRALDKCDFCVGIRMRNDWDSLNVSAAFAIFCDRILNG